MIKETIQEMVNGFKDTPLPFLWQVAWSRCKGQMIAIAYLIGFITTAMLKETVQTAMTLIVFVVLVFLTGSVYQTAKKVLIEEEKGGGRI